jgi:hypothetical protein
MMELNTKKDIMVLLSWQCRDKSLDEVASETTSDEIIYELAVRVVELEAMLVKVIKLTGLEGLTWLADDDKVREAGKIAVSQARRLTSSEARRAVISQARK